MSQIKDKIRVLQASTKIDGRYRTIFERNYPANPDYANLHYHNADHVRAVLNLFEVLRKLSGKGFEKIKLEATYLAAVFHDIDHSGHPDTHFDDVTGNNIGRAIANFTAWAVANKNMENPDDYRQVADAITLIKSTEYPLTAPEIKDPELRELSNMLRDADMLWGTTPGQAANCMIGMWMERKAAGLEEGKLDIEKVLPAQLNFIRNYQPLSAAGRTYKNAVFEEASTAWALAALQYERQLMAAQVVRELSDAEVLQVAQGIKSAVKEATAAP